ncbi:MAG: PAS domain S-box protein [Methanolobus sp.]
MGKASGILKKSKNKPDAGKEYSTPENDMIPSINSETAKTELVDIVDIELIRSLMEDFFQLTNIGITISDHNGHILVATGWQDVCINFHRKHPVASNYCIESDIEMIKEPAEGVFKFYHCKNKMWNISTPIIVDNLHLGNLMLGQFFFDDEEIPYQDFRLQAQEFGFDEKEYLEALDRVPRWNRTTIDKVMKFYSDLTHLISTIGYSNLKLAWSLKEKELLYESLREREEELKTYIEEAPDGIFVADKKGNFIEVNKTLCSMAGYSKEELLQTDEHRLTTLKFNDKIKCIIQNLGKNKLSQKDVNVVNRSGREKIWTVKTISLPEDRFVGFVQDVTEQKNTEKEKELTIKLLNLFNTGNDIPNTIQSIVELLQNWSGCDAVGIRMQDGDDFPYYVTQGFPSSFVVMENSLCAFDENGELIKDENGKVVLECMCGNVIAGRFNPEMPFFTEKGSFWTNSTSKLLQSLNSEEIKSLRNRCNTAGYESVALIPLCSENGNCGLIQLNDRRIGAFTIEKIELFEGLADSVALALMQKKVKKDLQMNENRLESIFKAAPIGIGVVASRMLIEVNSMMCAMTGYSKEELIGASARILYPTREEYEFVGKIKYHLIAENGTGTVETRWQKKDGSIINILLSSTPIDVNDLSVGVTFTALDITERKCSEEKIRESEALLNEMGRIARIGGWEVDLCSGKSAWTPEAANIHELTTDEATGVELGYEFYPPGSREIIKDAFTSAVEKAKPYDLELEFVTAKGKHRWVRTSGRPKLVDGKVVKLTGTLQDITESKISEETLRIIAETRVSPGDDIFHVLVRQIAVFQGAKYAILAEINNEDKKSARTIAVWNNGKFVDNFTYELRGTPCQKVSVKGPCFYASDVQRLFPDDILLKEMKADSYWGAPLKNSSGQTIGMLAIIDDSPMEHSPYIHSMLNSFATRAAAEMERRKAEEALVYSKLVADEANRIKSEFMKNMSHELRTPLTAVIGFSDVLLNQESEGLDEIQKNYIDYIHESGKNLLGLIDRILDFSKYEIEDIETLKLKAIHVSDFINENIVLMSKKHLTKV